ncbi:hypothetical protein [Shinella pollutisoli]|uniref:Uncharacterized protein n=1 Tax=Shinella pollutisoli TaxID=2250594 RepID=A0ABV7DEJ4_9HYPH|nr:hypothetical protein [Shinella pollutisoli]
MRILPLCLALVASPAYATDGFGCTAKDGNLAFTAEAGFSYSIGGGLLNFRGELALPAGLAPQGLENVALEPSHLAHDWLYDGELRLLVHAETGGDLPFASADLVVMTKATEDETAYAGDYTLILYRADGDGEPLRRTGRVTCSVG